MINTNVAFTVQESQSQVPVIATANSPASVDILELAGCNHVLQVADMLGWRCARRVEGSDRLDTSSGVSTNW
jgi:voltage-gated potassium channel